MSANDPSIGQRLRAKEAVKHAPERLMGSLTISGRTPDMYTVNMRASHNPAIGEYTYAECRIALTR